EMKTHMFPQASFQPNEFQAQLRAATTDVEEHAHESKVKLPENFNLGFDEYATSLPNGSAAPRLGWQLRAIQWLADTIVESHVDSITSLTRARLPEEAASAAPSPTPLHRPGATPRVMTPAKKIVDANSIEIIFSGSPTAVRRAINQIATAKEQFYVIRTLVVKNQVEKGPKRAGSGEAAPTPTLTPPARGATAAIGKTTEPAISFIVGTEHLDVSARIEILKFNLPEKENR
ncbi:MAG TPA: Amuc_1100 family pilus-like protein, partial [Chthoniobacterales bacterium]